MSLFSLGPIPSLNSKFLNGMGPKLGEGIPLVSLHLGGMEYHRPSLILFLLNELNLFTGQKEMELQKNVCYGEATATPVCLDPVYDEVAYIDMQIL